MMKNVNQEGSLCLEKKYGEIKGKKLSAESYSSIFFSHFLLFMKEGMWPKMMKNVNQEGSLSCQWSKSTKWKCVSKFSQMQNFGMPLSLS